MSEEVERAWFLWRNVTSLFGTNEEVNIENKKRIKQLLKPIVRIEAVNSCSEAKVTTAEKFYGLKNLLFLAVGAKVVLEFNLCPELGLSNRYTGIVKDIVYRDKENN